MQISERLTILFSLQLLFLSISTQNEQLSIVKRCLPSENFIEIAYILNIDQNSDKQLSDLANNLGENMTTFQYKRFKLFL